MPPAHELVAMTSLFRVQQQHTQKRAAQDQKHWGGYKAPHMVTITLGMPIVSLNASSGGPLLRLHLAGGFTIPAYTQT